jgi:predicted HTH transcriptional regulator
MSESPLPQSEPIEEKDLDALIKSEARENRFIEFKSENLLTTDGGRKKFLQSVAAFANSRGGDLVLGMKADGGIARACY